MDGVWEWGWFAAGLITLVLSAISGREESWRDKLFGLSMMISALLFRFAPVSAPGVTGTWRVLGTVIGAAGFAISMPSFVTGLFGPDKNLGQELGWAALAAAILAIPEGLLGPQAGWWLLLPLPACLWIISIVPRWLRRVYRRGQTRAVAWATLVWAVFCGVFYEFKRSDSVIAVGFLATLTLASALFILLPMNRGTMAHRDPH